MSYSIFAAKYEFYLNLLEAVWIRFWFSYSKLQLIASWITKNLKQEIKIISYKKKRSVSGAPFQVKS